MSDGAKVVVDDDASRQPRPTASAPTAETAGWRQQARDWYQRAVELREDGRPQLAADLLSRVLLLEPTSAFLRDEVAATQFRAGQYVGAWVTFTAMIAIDRRDSYAYYGLGMAEARLGELAAAQLHLMEAVSKAPRDRRYRAALRVVRSALAEGHPMTPSGGPEHEHGQPPSPVPAVVALELAPRVSDGAA